MGKQSDVERFFSGSRDRYRDKLGLSESQFEDILGDAEVREYEGMEYAYVPNYRHDIERGTAFIDGEVVRGFPKIPRTLVLEEGVPKHFGDDEFVVEEKYNGYNTRLAKIGGEVYGFTRGGIICPFTTAKARDHLEPQEFFDENPDLMICAETFGMENPYTSHEYPEADGLAVRVFDIRNHESGESVGVSRVSDICDDYEFPEVTRFGRFSASQKDIGNIKRIIERFDDESREGIIIKSIDVSHQLKYTTSSANQDDLRFGFTYLFDYGQDFMFRRILREVFQSVERDESMEEMRERAHGLGESLFLPAVDTVRKVDAGHVVGEEHVIRGESELIERTLDHLRDQGLHLIIEEDREVDGERVVKFSKRMQATNDKTQAYLDGKIVRE